VNERERSNNAGAVAGLSDYFLPLFRAVLRDATTIAANSFASFSRASTSWKGIRRVSGKNSSQNADSSISSREMLSFEINSARDLARCAAR
jgi:hypothetical protein